MKKKLIITAIILTSIGITQVLVSTNETEIYLEEIAEKMESPARPNSSAPFMHKKKNGTIYMSWMESNENGNTSLYYSILENGKWTKATLIAQGENWFVNFADFPSLSTFGENSVAVNHLQETPVGDFSYDVNLHLSNDNGSSWNAPFTPHQDNTPTEHGFVSMLPFEGKLLVVWLDGRNYFSDTINNISATNEMTLRSAVVSENGTISDEGILDDNTCSCCQTDAALTENGAIVVYRDRSKEEIREMSIVRFVNGIWTKPKNLSNDKWMIPGCPVNGPAIDAKGSLVAVTWFTAANDVAKTKLVFSNNSGETFGQPILISENDTRGNVDVVLLDDGSALVSWVEQIIGETTLKVRRVYQDGTTDNPIIIAKMNKSYIEGFPKMMLSDNAVYFAWTERGSMKSVKTAYLSLAKE